MTIWSELLDTAVPEANHFWTYRVHKPIIPLFVKATFSWDFLPGKHPHWWGGGGGWRLSDLPKARKQVSSRCRI